MLGVGIHVPRDLQYLLAICGRYKHITREAKKIVSVIQSIAAIVRVMASGVVGRGSFS
jgi:hypothetical protein